MFISIIISLGYFFFCKIITHIDLQYPCFIANSASPTRLLSSNFKNKLSLQPSTKLNTVWDLADYTYKQKLQYLVFSDGMLYSKKNNKCRTEKVNSIFSAIAELSRITDTTKKDNSYTKSELSPWVEPRGVEPLSKHIL